jgi:hypothetical protein
MSVAVWGSSLTKVTLCGALKRANSHNSRSSIRAQYFKQKGRAAPRPCRYSTTRRVHPS